jgi:Flp pilus assembly pilin Flp
MASEHPSIRDAQRHKSSHGLKERVEMRTFIKRFVRDDEGQDLVEYVLLVSLIALAVAAAFPPVTTAISAVFTRVQTSLAP